MGIDFIGRIRESFRRRESEKLRRLDERGLFDSDLPIRRVFRGTLVQEPEDVRVGQEGVLRLAEGEPILYDGSNRVVASVHRLPDDLRRLLEGRAFGALLVTVERVLELSGEVEIAIDRRS